MEEAILTENIVLKKANIRLTSAKKVSGMMLNLHGDLLARTSPALPTPKSDQPPIRERKSNQQQN
jgi:hypothetical protein